MQSVSPHQQDDIISEEEARRRQLLALARRPSYRKILNDLEGLGRNFQPKLELSDEIIAEEVSSEASTSALSVNDDDKDLSPGSRSPSSQPENTNFNGAALSQALALTIEGNNGSIKFTDLSPSTLLQYAQQTQQVSNGQTLLLPINGDVLNLKALAGSQAILASRATALCSVESSPASFLLQPSAAMAAAVALSQATSNVSPNSPALTLPTTSINVGNSPGNSSSQAVNNSSRPQSSARSFDDPQKKREVRLLKNREAAKECRRKKKEYIKCLENRVNTLEHQNTQLIEELKNLKALYCRKND